MPCSLQDKILIICVSTYQRERPCYTQRASRVLTGFTLKILPITLYVTIASLKLRKKSLQMRAMAPALPMNLVTRYLVIGYRQSRGEVRQCAFAMNSLLRQRI